MDVHTDYGTRDTIYEICYSHLQVTRRVLRERAATGFSKDEAAAHLKVAGAIFDLAAGAAIANQFPWTRTDKLTSLYREIEDIIEWNIQRT